MRRLFLLAFWALLAVIVFATLCPIELRPRTGHVISERFAAFALLGASFVAAYPRLFPVSILGAPLAGVALELAQTLISGRHGRPVDALEKLAGGFAGAAAAAAILIFWKFWKASRGRQATAERG